MARESRNNTNADVLIKISLKERPEFDGDMRVYAFDQIGTLLDAVPVKKDVAALSLTPTQARRARLFVAPVPDRGTDQKPTLESMSYLNAFEPAWVFDPDVEIHELSPIPGVIIDTWPLCLCLIRGRVVKSVPHDGGTRDAPVCGARVHICEVDRWPRLVFELPDYEIFELRDDLIMALKEKLVRPRKFPEPGPRPPVASDLRVIDPSPHAMAHALRERMHIGNPRELVSGTPMPIPPSVKQPELLRRAAAQHAKLGPQPEPPDLPALTELSPQPDPPDLPNWEELPVEFRIAMASDSALRVREGLVAHAELVRPLLCLWPSWWWYTCDEIAVVETNSQGRFEYLYNGLCGSDHPDLYFWVEYLIDGVWTTVHRPPLPCNVHWDYVCGTDVTIRVTDARVPVCTDVPDLPGATVAIMTIGNNVSFAEIQPSSAGANEGLTTDGQPFGGKLEPQVWFSRSSLFAKGITHYRWSYRRMTAPDGVTADIGGWHHMDRSVVRHYAVRDPVTGDLSFPADQMGPDPAHPGADLMRIQPINPPTGEGWSVRDAREDLASAHFMTHLLEGGDAIAAAGKYELKLELFKSTAPSTPVDLTAEGVDVKVSDQPAPYGTSTVTTDNAPMDNLITDTAGHVHGFRMVLRIDNTPCEAQIFDVSGAGLSMPNPNCGFIEYLPGSSASISFRARHRNGFATFHFEVNRGSGNRVDEASAHGSIQPMTINSIEGPPDGPFTRDSSWRYAKSVPVATLLSSGSSGPPCTRAAFSQTLYVYARATDGWGRLHHLDARGIPYAFALDQPS